MSLGRWEYLASSFVALVTTAVLLVPLGILLTWLAQDVAATSGSLALQSEYAFNPVLVAVATTNAMTLIGLPAAYLATRHFLWLDSIFERTTYAGYAVPGVALGLALVSFGSPYATPIYQILYSLVFAYVIRFLPQAIGSLRASFLRVDLAPPEAARTLGETPSEVLRHVTLPFVAPDLLSGVTLIFLTTMKKLPAMLLLRPSGFSTFVTHIWTAYERSYFGQAVAPAFILLFVSGLSMLVVTTQEGYDVKQHTLDHRPFESHGSHRLRDRWYGRRWHPRT